MTTTINADTVVGGAIVTGDASGQLGLQADGTTLVELAGTVVTVSTNATSTVISSDATFQKSIVENVYTLAGTDIDPSNGTIQTKVLAAPVTFTESISAGESVVLMIENGATHTITWPAAVDWAGGTAPDAPASGETDLLAFTTYDGGITWYGFQAGDAMA